MIASVAQSFFFLAIFGLGLGRLIGGFGSQSYLSYLAPGIIGMGLLFGSVFSGVSVVFDKQFGFMKEMLVAPVSRTSIVIGKILGGAVTASIQGIILMACMHWTARASSFQPHLHDTILQSQEFYVSTVSLQFWF